MSFEQAAGEVPDDDPIDRARKFMADGRAVEAVAFLTRHIEARRGGLLASLMLVRARLACDDKTGALELARELALANPQIAETALALGEALAAAQALPAAIAELQRALRIDSALHAARVALAQCWLDAGEPDKADEALANVPEGPDIVLLHGRANVMRAQPRCDAGYVRHLFDQFSVDYDVRMRGQLAYAAPEILRELARLVVPGRKELAILDLGCGTGLAGAAFKEMSSRLDGVDLSQAMLEQARAKGIYDGLRHGDLETMLGTHEYDLALAADALVYLGDLAATFTAVQTQLKRSGIFLFTVEKQDGDAFALGPKRRWRHSERYLRNLAALSGFDVVGLLDCVPRTESNAPVEGLACALAIA